MTDRRETAASGAAEGAWPLSSLVYATSFVAVLINAFAPNEYVRHIANGGMVLFILLEFRRTLPIPRFVGSILIAVGLAAAASSGQLWQSFWQGIDQTQKFLVIFGAVAWLQVPATESPSLRSIRQMVMTQTPGRRFAYLGGAAHLLGVGFNIAGLSLLAGMVSNQENDRLRRRLGRAMAQGFAAGTCWSPFYVGAAVILTAWPEVAWLDMAPYGIVLAILLTYLSWLLDRLAKKTARTDGSSSSPSTVSRSDWLRSIGILGVLFAGSITIVESYGVSIPVALAVVAPPLAFVWRASLAEAGQRLDHGLGFARRTTKALADLRGEILVFAGANMLGAGLSSAIDPATIAEALAALNLGYDGNIFLLVFGIVFCSFLTIHPVVLVVLVSQLLPPELLGISPLVMVLVLMAMWGISVNVSPVSGTILYLSRIAGENNFTVAWRWNPPFTLLASLAVASLAVAARHLGLGA